MTGGNGVHAGCAPPLDQWFSSIADRLRRTIVTCGSWKRVLSDCALGSGKGTAGILLDPPYAIKRGQKYAFETADVAQEVRKWAIEHGGDRRLRIALCGYVGEHKMPRGWREVAWKAPKGYQKDPTAGHRERIWFSPGCLHDAVIDNGVRNNLQIRAA